VARWVDGHGDGSGAFPQIEREPVELPLNNVTDAQTASGYEN
jgi:hypothetical protein